jgi:hypothetical protein
LKDVLRGEFQIAPLIGCERVLARAHLGDELCAVGLLLPRFLSYSLGRVGSDLITRSMFAMEMRSPARSSSLMVFRISCSLPRSQNGSWPCPSVFLADGGERGKEIDNAFQIARAASWARPFVMEGSKQWPLSALKMIRSPSRRPHSLGGSESSSAVSSVPFEQVRERQNHVGL